MSGHDRHPARHGALARGLRRRVLARLAGIRQGRLALEDPLGRADFGDAGAGTSAVVRVHDLSAYADIATGGSIGAAEAYMQGKWSASDLVALMRVLVANRRVLDGLEGGLAAVAAPLLRLAHGLRRNTRAQARRNIAVHYDLGNDFYRLFLDPTMSYSSCVFPAPGSTLEDAALHKLDLVCRKLALGPDDHLLEIGPGWGGLALHAAANYGCRVTTTTISARQREFATRRVSEAGLAGRVSVLGEDYRELRGSFDKLVSIEMIEAVGVGFLDRYVRVCSGLLKPGGRMLLQGIVISDSLFDRARRSVDFIQKYIFPGGALPSLGSIRSSVARATDLEITHLQDIGQDYARTLAEWRRRFLARLQAVRALGFGDEFIRMWEYYLAYCEGAFLERAVSDLQIVLDKPMAGGELRPAPWVGAL
jgi:cyclopropane-fatty-acyl-phospholipid synthase